MGFSFGRNVKALREQRKITQDQLAEALGISRQTVVKWEQGDIAKPRQTEVLDRLVNTFALSMDDVLGESNGLYAKLYGLSEAPEGAMRAKFVPAVTVPIRVLGTTYANTPEEAPLFDGEAMLYEAIAIRHPNCFALEVSGTCMDKVFTSEDYVFVDPDMEPQDGSIAVMLIDGKSETRRFRKGNDTVTLVSESHNPQPDIVIRRDDGTELSCQGVVFWWQAKGEVE